jgi:hypothetical protein
MPESDQVQKVMKALKYNRFKAHLAKNREDARKIILNLIPTKGTVGFGDSGTVRQIGFIPELEERGTTVINPMVKEWTSDLKQFPFFHWMLHKALECDTFICSLNAVTLDGKLVNIDGAGNRVAGTLFGPRNVILPVGRNKIVEDVEQGIHRIKNVIAPAHARHRNRKVPCAKTGKCEDCNAKARICCMTVIIEKQPHLGNITVVLVDEDLGLGWDPSWPDDRINKIKSHYEDVTWEYIAPWHPKREG